MPSVPTPAICVSYVNPTHRMCTLSVTEFTCTERDPHTFSTVSAGLELEGEATGNEASEDIGSSAATTIEADDAVESEPVRCDGPVSDTHDSGPEEEQPTLNDAAVEEASSDEEERAPSDAQSRADKAPKRAAGSSLVGRLEVALRKKKRAMRT